MRTKIYILLINNIINFSGQYLLSQYGTHISENGNALNDEV